jgi:exonuclease III
MKKLLEETKYPDLVCLQEARLKAYDQHTRGRPLPSEYAVVKDTVESVFENYTPVWSLADNRYAGTLTFVHKRLGLDRTSQCAFSTDSAIDLMLKRFQRNREQVGLVSLSKPSSPAKKVVKQTSMKSFFAPKKMTSSGESSSPSVCTRNHHSEGRFQFFSFPDMDVIQTYVPNNGTKEESFCRRSQWDASMLQFVKDRRKLLEHCQQTERPLLWCGDFNVARDYRDGTHWEKREDGSIYEFWTNPEKCFVGKKGSVPTPENQENVGMPSFTAAERRRFSELLKEGDFSDVWRELHPTGVANSKLTSWDRPDYTWRGHLAQAGNYKSKFQGKAQRLDYFLLSPSKLVNNVDACQILGYGEQREGHYCGSDHCATVLSLCERLT